ncbi:MAG: hypothetical protein LBG44_03485 [Gemmatimonadota bacterium]|nr:hypothetical protein [Gemmatimonadota bacterium]
MRRQMIRVGGLLLTLAILDGRAPGLVCAQEPVVAIGDSVSVRLVDADVRSAIQALGRYLDRPVILGDVGGRTITLETPQPVPRSAVLPLLRGILESQDLLLIEEGDLYQIRSRQPQSFGQGGGSGFQGQSTAPQSDGTVDLFVIRLRHARASDVAATVNALYGRASAPGELGGPPPTLSDQLRQNRIDSSFGGPLPDAGVSRGATLQGQLVIVPDTRTNSILIRSTSPDFELVRAAVEQLDIRPLQVLIEVLIAEVRTDAGFSLGLAAVLPEQHLNGTTNTVVSGSSDGLGLGDFVLQVMDVGGHDLSLTLSAAASKGDVSILSRPVVLTANNEPAKVVVGSQRPFVQVQRSLPTDGGARDQVVQYMDVGTQLSVTPTISEDGYVMLDVVQEVNAATSETAFDAPVISTRSVQTQLLVRDGQTAVLGGLTDRQQDISRSGVPGLSRLPLIGWLFGRRINRTTGTELFIFLTPRVIRGDDDLDSTSSDVRDSARRTRDTIEEAIEQSPARRGFVPPPAASADQ